jgi:hypothetical protein
MTMKTKIIVKSLADFSANALSLSASVPGRAMNASRLTLGATARASARFNVRHCGALKIPSPLAFWALKRRERRAPFAPSWCHPDLRASISDQANFAQPGSQKKTNVI